MERDRILRIYAKGDVVGEYNLERILSHVSKFIQMEPLRKYVPCETILVKIKTLTKNGVHLSRISENKIQLFCLKIAESFGDCLPKIR